jgi:flotillin
MDAIARILLAVLFVVIAVIAMIVVYGTRYKRVPPNKAMVVFGRPTLQAGKKGYLCLTGGGKFIVPIVEEVKYLPLDVRNLKFKLNNVKTDPKIENARLKLEASAIIKIASDPISLDAAAEMLLDKKDNEINKMAYDVIEAHIKGICKTLTFEIIDTDRDRAVEMIQNMAAKDLRNIGLEIRSMVINDVKKVS